jgi:hypothetical protein
MKRALVLWTGLFLAACAGTSTTSSTTASNSKAPTPSALAARFVTPDPSVAKIAANQSGANVFAYYLGFHEVGLLPGQSVTYRASGTGTADYSCNRTNGTLDSSPGSQQTATGQVKADQTFAADDRGEVSGVVIIPPPAPTNPNCPPGYAVGAWRSSYTGMSLTDRANNLTWAAPDAGTQAQ